MAISIDPETGVKRFSTRAAKASEKILGKGYSLVNEESLKTLPEQFPGVVLDRKSRRSTKSLRRLGAVPGTMSLSKASLLIILKMFTRVSP